MLSLILAILLTALAGCIGFLIWCKTYNGFDCPYEPHKEFICCRFNYSEEQVAEMEKEAEARYQEKLVQYNKAVKKVAKQKRIYYGTRITIFTLVMLFVLIGTYVGISYGFSKLYQRDLIGYEAEKMTIEQSLANESLTGLEKFELVQQASKLNKWLAHQKFDYERWAYFDIDKTVKKAYKDAEFINFESD